MMQHRGVVVAKNGVVAASQPLAVSVGLGVLMRGGSFVDAALATSATLAVVEPSASHLGGDAFVIVYDAKTGKTTALNGSGAAPLAASLDRFPDGIPLRGLIASSVPGLVDTWFALHERWGRLPVSELLAPAIAYAAEGFPMGYRTARICREYAPLLRQYSPDSPFYSSKTSSNTSSNTFSKAPSPTTSDSVDSARERIVPRPGLTVRQPDLAWTLGQIAEGGRDAFYAGPITERILAHSEATGGLFAAEDFARHRTQITPPLRTSYRGYTVHGQPPVSQGHILLQQLNLVEGFDLAGLGHNSADAIHLQVEAKKLAFADRAAYLGDPNFVSVPMETLLSKAYAAERREQIDPHHAASRAQAGEIHHDTTYFCIADAEGNAISFIQSVFHVFGCGVFVPGTGMLFNNRLTGFSLDPDSPNVLAPGKRTAHTLNAYIVTKGKENTDEKMERKTDEKTDEKMEGKISEKTDGKTDGKGEREEGRDGEVLAYVGGTPGADVQVQSNLQVICNLIDFGMNPQEAVEAARWQHGPVVTEGGTQESAQREALSIERRFEPESEGGAEAVRTDLEERGHQIVWLGPWAHSSSYQVIAFDPQTGTYQAGSDPRCDGHAAGF